MWHTCWKCKERAVRKSKNRPRHIFNGIPVEVMFRSRAHYVLCFLHWLEWEEEYRGNRDTHG